MGVREAIRIAIDYVKDLFQGDDYRLEEVSLVEGDVGAFSITVSFRLPAGSGNAVTPLGSDWTDEGFGPRRAAIGIDPTRVYKEVVVGGDGQVRSVRMRQIVVG